MQVASKVNWDGRLLHPLGFPPPVEHSQGPQADANPALEARREGGYTSTTASWMELFMVPLTVSPP